MREEDLLADRLTLIAITPESLAAEKTVGERLGKVIGARITVTWPPENWESHVLDWLLAQCAADAGCVGWSRYVAVCDADGGRTLSARPFRALNPAMPIFASSNIKPPVQILGTGLQPFFTSYRDSFSDNQDTSWINVGVSNMIGKAIVHSCQTKIRIDPNGNDTWKFNYWVRLLYSDGTHDEYHFDGHALSEKVRENTFNLR